MTSNDFSASIMVNASPDNVYNAIKNVRRWWSEAIEGNMDKPGDEFKYRYKDVHACTIKIMEAIPCQKITWLVLDNHFNFTKDKTEWKDTQIIFEILKAGPNSTQVKFTHRGLVPEYECYAACVNGWTHYITQSLHGLITIGKGQPNSSETTRTIHEVVARFNELAQQEKWFEIQDELFADDVKSIEPEDSLYLEHASGKMAVRKKGEAWLKRIEAVHGTATSQPVISGRHFAVGREMDLNVRELGRVQINELMLYKVIDGKIVSEQFFY